jgi:hypothetical protein
MSHGVHIILWLQTVPFWQDRQIIQQAKLYKMLFPQTNGTFCPILHPIGLKVLVDAARLQQLEEDVRALKETASRRRGSHKAGIKARAAALVAMMQCHPAWAPEQLRDALDIALPHTM